MADITPQFIKNYLESTDQQEWNILSMRNGILASALMDAEPRHTVRVAMTQYEIVGRKMVDIPVWYQMYLDDLSYSATLADNNKDLVADKYIALAVLEKYL